MKRIFTLAVLCLFLAGCSRIDAQTTGRPRLVTRVSASFDSGAIRLHRIYENDEKMRWVLQYLRCLDVMGESETPPPPAGEWAEIQVEFSDGSREVYQQWGQGYFRQDQGPWQKIKPEQARELPLLLGLMESDL